MKYLIVLLVFAAVIGFLYWRLRPYIRIVRRFIGVAREVNRMRRPAAASDLPGVKPERASAESLVRCAVCGTWVPGSSAVTLRASKTTYCSHSCLERAADAPRRVRRTAT